LGADLAGSGSLRGASAFDRMGVASGQDPVLDVGRTLTDLGANLVGATIALRSGSDDLFVREELEHLPAVRGLGVVSPILYGLDFRADGVRYEVRAQHDIVDRFGLFRYDDTVGWTKVADLTGGYGTTGQEVVFALPLRLLDPVDGGRLSHVRAFTALGAFDIGRARLLDVGRI
jgi:hypothetical protein